MTITMNISLKSVKHLISQKMFHDSFYSLVGNVTGRGSLLVAGILVARVLEKDFFGEYSIIKETMTYMGLFAAFGLGYSGTQSVAKCVEEHSLFLYPLLRSIYLIVFCTGFLSLFIICAFSECWIHFLELSVSRQIFLFSALIIVFNAVNNVQTGILSGFKHFKAVAYNVGISGIVTVAVTFPCCRLYGLSGALAALIASSALQCILNAVSIRKFLRSYPKPRGRNGHLRQSVRAVFKLTLPITLNESLYMLLHWGGVIVLIKCYSKGDIGLFNAALVWNSTILFIPGALRSVGLSYLSSSRGGKVDNLKILSNLIILNACAVILPSLLILFFSDFVVSFYGPSFSGLKRVLQVLISATFFQCISIVLSQELIALKKSWLLFLSGFLRDSGVILLTLLFFFIGIKQQGAVVFSTSTLIMHILYLGLLTGMIYLIHRKGNAKSAA